MKHDLRRIEATLETLRPAPPEPSGGLPVPSLPVVGTPPPAPSPPDRGISFKMQAASPPPTLLLPNDDRSPALPLVDSSTFTTQRGTANPALAMNLLRELEGTVSNWQLVLQTVMQQIQELYREGPIVAAWLESYAQDEAPKPDLRHADLECLLDYVEKHWTAPPRVELPSTTPVAAADTPSAGYRLCGLTEDGKPWFRHCPAEQVPVVSLAIARYHRLQQLLSRKDDLETRLSQLAETLIEVHHQAQT